MESTLSGISLFGLGKLGSAFFAAFLSQKIKTIGVDIRPEVVNYIRNGNFFGEEPYVHKYFLKYKKNISVTTNVQEAMDKSSMSFIIVPTPSLRNGSFSNRFVFQCLKEIGLSLRKKNSFHLVNIVSTISPGTMPLLVSFLEKETGKKVGQDIGLCYNPSFIALGNIIHNLLYPDFVLIGESDKKAGNILEAFYKKFCCNTPPIRRMNFINAEIAKIALNTYITAKISYGNMIAQLCEHIPGADAQVITQTIGLDARVGQQCLQGGSAYGGPCFPRDNRALTAVGKKYGVPLSIAEVTDTINKTQTRIIAALVLNFAKPPATIGILGLSYKPHTNVIEESQGINLAMYLRRKNFQLLLYDPVAQKNAEKIFQKTMFADSMKAMIEKSDVMVITTPWPAFKKEIYQTLTNYLKQRIIIIDCWHLLQPGKLPHRVVYICRGQYAGKIKQLKKN